MDGISGRESIPVCGPCGALDWRASVFQGHEVDVSIIIVNWNTRNLLRLCLRALVSGIGGVHAQILVVDNGSIDGSPVLVAEEFPRVELLRNPENVGFARANNQAYRQ